MELLLPIFCDIDDFCKEYENYCKTHLLLDEAQYLPKTSMSLSEIMTIIVYFHLSNHRTFKWYYKKYICVTLKDCFPKLLSYNRFIEVMPMVIAPSLLFEGDVERGKSSTGWFYGFKLHLVINEKGELLSCCLTAGNVDDRNPEVIEQLAKEIFGKLFGDRGYLSQKLFEELYQENIVLVTKLKKKYEK